MFRSVRMFNDLVNLLFDEALKIQAKQGGYLWIHIVPVAFFDYFEATCVAINMTKQTGVNFHLYHHNTLGC